jgi:hypothetical protein
MPNYFGLAVRQAPVQFSAKPQSFEENGKWRWMNVLYESVKRCAVYPKL